MRTMQSETRSIVGRLGGRSGLADTYRLEFHFAGGYTVAETLSIEDVDEIRRTGGHVTPSDTQDAAEIRRRVLRTRLSMFTEEGATGHLVAHDESGAEWVVPMRSVLATSFTEPGASGRRMGFAPPGILDVDVPSMAPLRVIPGGKGSEE